jgi:hypothetical protein
MTNGNKTSLAIGGIRSYNQENLFSKSLWRIQTLVFKYCLYITLCISTDGLKGRPLRVSSIMELVKAKKFTS